MAAASAARRRKPPRPRKRQFSNPAASYARRLERYRPGLVEFTLQQLRGRYGAPTWERRLDPTSELILTILTQNSADTNAEKSPSTRCAGPTPVIGRPKPTSPAAAGVGSACPRHRRLIGRGSSSRLSPS